MNNNSPSSHAPKCRFCASALSHTFADLASSPLCQKHITPEEWDRVEPFYPLYAWVCDKCHLVQLAEYVSPSEIFNDYAYFSSFSTSWLDHAKSYAEQMIGLFIRAFCDLPVEEIIVWMAANWATVLVYETIHLALHAGVRPFWKILLLRNAELERLMRETGAAPP